VRPVPPRSPRRLLAALSVLVLAAASRAGIAVDGRVALINADFAAGLAGWSATNPAAVSAGSGPAADRSTLTFVQQSGTSELRSSLLAGTRGLPPAPAPGTRGEKLEFGAWLHLAPNVGTGQLVLEIVARVGAQAIVLARSAPVDAAAPRSTWFFVATEPLAGVDGRLPVGTVQVEFVVRNGLTGRVDLDDVRAGRFERSLFAGLAGGFEDPRELREHWARGGGARLASSFGLDESYQGSDSLCLPTHVSTWARTVLPVGLADGDAVHAREVMAGLWLRGVASTPFQPAQPCLATLEVRALRPGEPERAGRVLARGQHTTGADGIWRHLRTSPLLAVPLDADRLVVEVRKSGAGALVCDLLQAGEPGAVHGLAPRHVSCNYVARYRSPLSPLCTTNPVDGRGKYGTWAWLQGPWSDPNSTALRHDPSCVSAPNCIRPNGRRDLAISTLSSLDDLPLAGGYDSRDPHVIAWHVELAEAIGLDSLIFDHHGHALALQLAEQGGEDLNERAFETLLDVCDRAEHDLKVAAMYEPKVHMLGWVQGQTTLAAKKAGIRADLSDLLGRHGERRSYLRYDGRPVVFLFAERSCSPNGTQCLGDQDWVEILAGVRADTGLEPFVVADEPPLSPAPPFQGLSRWSLAYGTFLKYASYTNFAHGIASQPPVGALSSFSALVHGIAEQWRRVDDAGRVAVPIVWPGFDDSGVAGWSGPNFPGADGAPISVRVASRFGGRFYDTTVASARATHAPWIQIATWNDWNECTQIEPRWDATFAQSAAAGTTPDGLAARRVLARALATQQWIRSFRGGALEPPADLVAPTASYVWRAAHVGGVTRYD